MQETITHITDVDINTITQGDLIEQAGAIYRVERIARSQYFNGIEAIYYVWTGSDESDLFRSIVNSRDAIGQIRWEAPYCKPEADNGYSVKVSA